MSLIPDYTLIHGKSLSIPLSTYFNDIDGDAIKIKSKAVTINSMAYSGGLITIINPLDLDVVSTSISETGTYLVTLVITDTNLDITTNQFKLIVTNEAPI